jgi:hypothetical protein
MSKPAMGSTNVYTRIIVISQILVLRYAFVIYWYTNFFTTLYKNVCIVHHGINEIRNTNIP